MEGRSSSRLYSQLESARPNRIMVQNCRQKSCNEGVSLGAINGVIRELTSFAAWVRVYVLDDFKRDPCDQDWTKGMSCCGTQSFSGSDIKRPISAAVPAPETHPFFGTRSPTPDSYTFWRKCGLELRERLDRLEIGSRIRTFFEKK
jgi:hypothetical protein